MKIKFICNCGLENCNLEDWLSHWKHGTVRKFGILANYPKLRAIYHFCKTKIVIER